MESWRKVWREGIAQCLTENNLRALKEGLLKDDNRITQGSTTTPPPLMICQDYPIEAACPIGYAGWKSEGLETVGQVEEFFARICYETDQKIGEAAVIRWFLNWVDDSPRQEVIKELLTEVEITLKERE